MNFVPISYNAARQSIDAINIWMEYQNAKAAAQHFAGGMYWKKGGAYEYMKKYGTVFNTVSPGTDLSGVLVRKQVG